MGIRAPPTSVTRVRFRVRSQRLMWVEFVVGSLPAPTVFLWPGFPLSTITNTSKFQFHFHVGRLNTSPRLGRLGDHSLRFLTLNKVFLIYLLLTFDVNY